MDRYELGDLVGRGGMGEVYLGHDKVLGRRVAIKLLADRGARADADLVQRLLDEARVNALLEHPNVVRVHDLSISDATIFVVMEYLEGETLRARMRRDAPFPIENAVRIAADVCLALAAAHDADVVHRDIGPGNIMLCADDTVKVMDFGIAGVAGSTFAAGQTLGTPAYVSPEQAAGTAVDARSDLYSLGCTLYHILTGRPPFTGERAVEVAWQHCYADPRPPSTLRSDLPAAVEAVVLQAMAKSPEQRYDSALQMREALLSALDDSAGEDATPAVGRASPANVSHDAVPATSRAVRTYPPGAHVDWAAVEAADLVGAGADRRRERLGMAMIVLALALLGVVLVVVLRTA
jgi:serine/threonine protein kinase